MSADPQVNLANQYADLRSTGKTDDLMKMVTDDIKISSVRDGTYQGKTRVQEYFETIKPKSTDVWEKARRTKDDRVVISGKSVFMYMTWDATAYFNFDTEQIKSINIKLGRPD